MNENFARQLFPVWAEGEGPVRIYERPARQEVKAPRRMRLEQFGHRLLKRYGIFLCVMCIWTISLICCSAIASHNTEKAVRAELAAEYELMLEQYKAEQRQAEQASYFLSGDASREAAINQEVDAVAKVIARLATDGQKATEACCMLARVMSPSYPDSFREVAEQPQQWMFYDGTDQTFSAHDREIAESIVRPYMESGIIPTGLTSEMVYGEWSPSDFVLRDSYQTTSTMHTWRYAGA